MSDTDEKIKQMQEVINQAVMGPVADEFRRQRKDTNVPVNAERRSKEEREAWQERHFNDPLLAGATHDEMAARDKLDPKAPWSKDFIDQAEAWWRERNRAES